MLGQIALVLVFTVVGGCFAAAEIALVSLRPAQVSRLAAESRRGRTVQRLLARPNRFLSAGQIGITLAATLSSAFSALTFAGPVSTPLRRAGLAPAAAAVLALVLVTVVVSYVLLVIGELAPKRLALQWAEPIALLAAGPLDFIARATRPVIWTLGISTDLAVRLVGADPRRSREAMTEQELRDIVATSDELTLEERRMIAEVLNAGDRPIREVMVPRLDVHALQTGLSVAQALDAVRGLPNSRYPVVEGGLDDVAGFVHVRDLYAAAEQARPDLALRELVRPVMRMPDSRRALPALAEMRKEGAQLAVVVDEYGGGAGIVTLEDLLEELVGDITDEFDENLVDSRRGEIGDGSPPPLHAEPVDAQLRLEEFEEETGVRLPDGPYDTAAGWMLFALGRIPSEGDQARHGDITLTVTQLRGRRVERVRLARSPAPSATESDAAIGDEHPANGRPTREHPTSGHPTSGRPANGHPTSGRPANGRSAAGQGDARNAGRSVDSSA